MDEENNIDLPRTIPENDEDVIARLYTGLLGRAPDGDGLNFWVGELEDAVNEGKSRQQAIYDIAESIRVDADDAEFTEFSDDAKEVIDASGTEDLGDGEDAQNAKITAFVAQLADNVAGLDVSTLPDAAVNPLVEAIRTDLDNPEAGPSIGKAVAQIHFLDQLQVASGTINNRVEAGKAFADNLPDNAVVDSIRAEGESLNSSVDGSTADPTAEGETAAGNVQTGPTVQTVDAQNTDLDATDGVDQFDITSGTYDATVDGFEDGDILNAFPDTDVAPSITVSNSEIDDGEVDIEFANGDTGQTANLTLTGLSSDNDTQALFNQDSINDVFGDGTLVLDGSPGDGDGSDGDGSDGDDQGGGATSINASNAQSDSPFDATTGDVQFSLASGTYDATINGFDDGDILNAFPDTDVTPSITVSNSAVGDGEVDIQFANGDTGQTANVTLTGLSSDNDTQALFNQSSINDVFGDGTLLL